MTDRHRECINWIRNKQAEKQRRHETETLIIGGIGLIIILGYQLYLLFS